MKQTTKGTLRNRKTDFEPSGSQRRIELSQLLNYGTELRRRGYSKNQIDRISCEEARILIENNVPPFAQRQFSVVNKSIDYASLIFIVWFVIAMFWNW